MQNLSSKVIRFKRLKKKISQRYLGRKIGVSHVFVSRMERGLCLIPQERVGRLCTILGIDEKVFREQVKNDFLAKAFGE